MSQRDEFSTEEYSMYAAECRRMARLARRSGQKAAPRGIRERESGVGDWLRSLLMPAPQRKLAGSRR